MGQEANRERVREKKSGIPDSSRRDNGVWRGKKPSDHMQEKQSCHNSTKPERSKTILRDCSELLIHSQMAGPLLPELVKCMIQHKRMCFQFTWRNSMWQTHEIEKHGATKKLHHTSCTSACSCTVKSYDAGMRISVMTWKHEGKVQTDAEEAEFGTSVTPMTIFIQNSNFTVSFHLWTTWTNKENTWNLFYLSSC